MLNFKRVGKKKRKETHGQTHERPPETKVDTKASTTKSICQKLNIFHTSKRHLDTRRRFEAGRKLGLGGQPESNHHEKITGKNADYYRSRDEIPSTFPSSHLQHVCDTQPRKLRIRTYGDGVTKSSNNTDVGWAQLVNRGGDGGRSLNGAGEGNVLETRG
jgi:hypothetical protein